ncbi:MAG: glycosyltransferase family 2 protein [Flavobacteriales bacterium]
MDVSIVIVNYNVEHFLEQCLISVERAIASLKAEVFVVDNNSVDGSCAMVRSKFPWVKLIANTDNLGFSKANNQAMRLAEGRYILLLNPDTVVEEDTFVKCLSFMDEHPQAGGLGVRMVDGKGRFLPESKRGLPTPWVAFCKISGIYRVFRQSKRFNHYYMGYLGEHATNPVEILSGAYMWMRKKALDEVGLLDEAFFMYGEDIDLSWRIVQGGYENYYLPETTIIHYKGESTKKGSLNYVFVFYQAMVIFARKHFSAKNARLFTTLINLAIYARAAVAVFQRFLSKVWLPVVDFFALTGGWWAIARYYADWQEKIFEPRLLTVLLPAFTFVGMASQYFGGGYDKPLSLFRMLRSSVFAGIVVLVGYSLLPEDVRFSRAVVLLGGLWMLMYPIVSRFTLSKAMPRNFQWESRREQRFIAVGMPNEIDRIAELIRQTQGGMPEIIRFEHPDNGLNDTDVLTDRLNETIRVFKADVVIFSGQDLTSASIIALMSGTAKTGVDYKIAPPDSVFMIGSNSIDTSGDLFMLQTNGIHKPSNARAKRIFDLVASLALLMAAPFVIWGVTRKMGYFRNVFRTLIGRTSWVGYDLRASSRKGLPKVRPGVVSPATQLSHGMLTDETLQRLNLIYARDYQVKTDLALLWRNFKHLGNA